MSADNWDVCPTCSKRRDESLAAMEIDVANAYGTVSVDGFDRLRTELEVSRSSAPEHTFREDYEIWGAHEGVVTVSYSGHCAKCQTGLKFTHEHPIPSVTA